MSRMCIVCGAARPNEQFGGRGRRAVVCKRCRRLGRDHVDAALERLWMEGLADQNTISPGNVARLHALAIGDRPELARMAIDCLALAALGNDRKQRRKQLRKIIPELGRAAWTAGWIPDCDDSAAVACDEEIADASAAQPPTAVDEPPF